MALHAPDDRVAHSAAIGGYPERIEADAPVADEHLDTVRLHLGVKVDALAARELGGIRVAQRALGPAREAVILLHELVVKCYLPAPLLHLFSQRAGGGRYLFGPVDDNAAAE